MPRTMMNDMIPPEKRTIRRIPIERAKRTASRETPTTREESVAEDQPEAVQENSMLPSPPPRFRAEGRARRLWLWGAGIVIALVVVILILSSAFAGATLAVMPQQESVTVSGQFQAFADPEPGQLGFQVVTFTDTGSQTVRATGEEQVDTKASGIITIFNNFGESSERLIKNTRFETPEGLIYRLDKSVEVPGRFTNNAGEVVPGSVDATVFADTSGTQYNIGNTDFTIPAFKEQDDPRYFKFFARSKTPMTGGFSGIQRTVSEADEETARAAIRSSLGDSLAAQVQSQIPEGGILYIDGVFIEFTSEPNANTERTDEVNVIERGMLYGIMFDQAELAGYIARNTIARYADEPVRFMNLTDLEFALVDKETLAPAALGTVNFTLGGSGTVIWTFDGERLKEDLAGKEKDAVDTVLSGYPAIERAEIHLRPLWKRSFPENTKRITVEEMLQDAEDPV
ncbi:hypothetical protein L0Y40_02445 [Candidatus Wolfebacteria bacterium]|nr:hypothetical protein [Candidatus Wolfebacteria bacterium]